MLVAVFALGQQTAAQSLTFSLFERYLGALRDQAGIPGMAAAIVQNGDIVWDRGFGLAKIDGAIPVTRNTPFAVNDLTQTVASSLVLRRCVDSGNALLDDLLIRWSPTFPDRAATFRQVLSHTSASGFAYSRTRFSGLGRAVEECTGSPFAITMVQEVLDRFMEDAVPGADVLPGSGSAVRLLISTQKLNSYIATLQRIAVPYRVDANRHATASDYRVPLLGATDGLVASANDLARLDAALDAGALVRRATLDEAWKRQGVSPMGLGWFVQVVGGHQVKWHFGQASGAYSSLIIKVPAEHITLILLANSDGLSAPFPLANGDVTVSPFARIFFSLLG